MNDYVDAGETLPIFVSQMVDAVGDPVTGLTVSLALYRVGAGQYWNGTIWTTYSSVNMIETDSTNLPGHYHYNFIPAAGTEDYVLVSVVGATGGTPVNTSQSGVVVVGVTWDAFATEAEVFTRASFSQLTGALGEIKGTGFSTPGDTLEGIRNAVDAASGLDVLKVEVTQSAELRSKLTLLEDELRRVRLLVEILSRNLPGTRRS